MGSHDLERNPLKGVAMSQLDPHRRVGIHRVRELCGNVSEVSIWRWLNDPDLDFPQPIYIARRRYWREVDVIEWLDARSRQAA